MFKMSWPWNDHTAIPSITKSDVEAYVRLRIFFKSGKELEWQSLNPQDDVDYFDGFVEGFFDTQNSIMSVEFDVGTTTMVKSEISHFTIDKVQR